jgi:hypothetical protein
VISRAFSKLEDLSWGPFGRLPFGKEGVTYEMTGGMRGYGNEEFIVPPYGSYLPYGMAFSGRVHDVGPTEMQSVVIYLFPFHGDEYCQQKSNDEHDDIVG